VNKLAVITGAASGMGNNAAIRLGGIYDILMTDINKDSLEVEAQTLRDRGITVYTFPCNVANREQVTKLAEYATQCGTVGCVVHAAGIAPGPKAVAEQIFTINAMGTAYMTEAFFPVLDQGGVMINVASMSSYMSTGHVPYDLLRLNPFQPEFLEKNLVVFSAMEAAQAPGFAYLVSKHFVRDYTARNAMRFGKRGVRILSISPGNIMTPMYFNEVKDSCDSMLPQTPIGRHGKPEEISDLIAFLVSSQAAFITGIDVLCDGGCVAGMTMDQVTESLFIPPLA